MNKRFITFLTLSSAIVIMNFTIMWRLQKNRPAAPPKKAVQQAAAGKPVEKKAAKQAEQRLDKKAAPGPAADEPPAEQAGPIQAEVAARNEPELEWISLGSADAADPYRMLVTLTNRGAAVERIELNSHRFHDLEDRSGYLGHLEGTKPPDKAGYLVQVVGAGTPAAKAGLKPGDIITA